jgi:LysR family transcriptional regulator, cys regulon transcriptional activator
MTLQQLRYLSVVAENGLSITAAARRLRTSQPGISKQIRLLERELGFSLFERQGRMLIRLTAAGQRVVDRAGRIMRETQGIRGIADELRQHERQSLSIATTHTQARYVLPSIVDRFVRKHPQIQLHLHQGTSEQIARMLQREAIDFAIATGSRELFPQLVLLPCYACNRRIVVPRDHPLARVQRPSLDQVAAFPIVTYNFSFSGPASLHDLFAGAGLRINLALTAPNADVIKTYVRLRLGIGIIASMAYDSGEDDDLASLDASHLFPSNTTWIGFPHGTFLNQPKHDFIALIAPHLERSLVEQAAGLESDTQVADLLKDLAVPQR